ncbi:hypothetical protein CK203_108739 [Vitis vinifera]|uniref:Uncharacterized protein n=1 Tax=Vitis vinifera TaxID=29760 RepID=A0A438CGK9_VITVI|nr:hypothetical protein CK203_108739 [Vitis vinifera]
MPLYLEEELPPSMFFIDALLHHNISHCSIGCREDEFCWRHCLGSLRDTSLALTISSSPLFCTLKRRCIRRNYSSRCHSTSLPHTIMPDIGAPRIPTPAGPEHPEQPEEPVDIPSDTQPPAPVVASSEPILEVPPSAPQATPQPPPVIPPISEPFPSAEPRIAIPIIKSKIIATRAQHTTFMRQIQHHLGLISAPEHATPNPPKPAQAPSFVDQTMPPEETTTGKAEPAKPSSPQHPPPII